MQRVSAKQLFIIEIIATLLCLSGLILLSLLWQVGVGANPTSQLVEHAAAPWVFGPIQVLLIYLPTWLAGIIIPVALVSVLFGLPWLSKLSGERIARILFILICCSIVILLSWFAIKEYWRT